MRHPIEDLSISVKNRLVKDYSLPIHILDEPYFSHLLYLYDLDYNTVDAASRLLIALNSLGSEEAFFAESKRIQHEMMDAISASAGYEKFIDNDAYDCYYPIKDIISGGTIYQQNHIGKYALSIDIIKANFNSMKLFERDQNVNIFDNIFTYEEFISQYTDLRYFIDSKRIRQVVFGNLYSKQQLKIQKFYTSRAVKSIFAVFSHLFEEIFIMGSDEIVLILKTTDEAAAHTATLEIMASVSKETLNGARLFSHELFKISGINAIDKSGQTIKSFYVKENPYMIIGSVQIKATPSYFMPQVYKFAINREIEDLDLAFYHDGVLASFNEALNLTKI